MIAEDTKKKDRIMATFWSALQSATCRYKRKTLVQYLLSQPFFHTCSLNECEFLFQRSLLRLKVI